MNWQNAILLVGAVVIGFLAFGPTTLIFDFLRDVWRTWNGRGKG